MAFIGSTGGLALGLLGQGGGGFRPRIQSIDLSLLAIPTTNPLQQQQDEQSRVIPPWRLPEEEQLSLARDVDDILAAESIVDENAQGVDFENASGDQRATFILYDALTRLETLAQFASGNGRSDTELEELDRVFQRGLDEISQFLGETELDLLTLLEGERKTSVRSVAEQEDFSVRFTGQVIAERVRDRELPGIEGNETFAVELTRGGVSETVVIDLSEIEGEPNIVNVVGLINEKIREVPALDENGDPRFRSDGTPIPRFTTRFAVEEVADGEFAIQIRRNLLEGVNLLSLDNDPSLYVTANRSELLSDDPDVAQLLRFGNADGDIEQTRQTRIAGVDADATVIEQASSDDDDDDDTATIIDNALNRTSILQEGEVAAETSISAVAVDHENGFIYTVGNSAGDFGSQLNDGEGPDDVYLNKLDSAGNVIFTRLLGTAEETSPTDLRVDSQGNVIIVGETRDNIGDGAFFSGRDTFITKFNGAGEELFTSQLDTFATDAPTDVVIDDNDNIIITGFSAGNVDRFTENAGGRDALLLRFDGETGARTDTALFGTSGQERGQAVTVDDNGDIVLVSNEDGRAVLRRIDGTDFSNVLLEQDLGDIGAGGTVEKVVASGGNIVLAGATTSQNFDAAGASVINGASGRQDGFVLKLTDNGTAPATGDFLTFVGSEESETVADVSVTGQSIFLAGSTSGVIEGNARRGVRDGYLARISLDTGAIENVEQFGQRLQRVDVTGVAFAQSGRSVLDALGLPQGNVLRFASRQIEAQTTAKPGDYFEFSVDGGRPRRVELEAGDSFADLVRRINIAARRRGLEADIADDQIAIRPDSDTTIELFAGEEGRDLLSKLGIEPQRVLGVDLVFGLDDESEDDELGGVFGLELSNLPLNLRDRQSAEYTFARIQETIETVQRAFRSLSPSPLDDPRNGPAPPRIQNQLANYTAALRRLQAGGGGFGGGGLFI